MAFNITSWGKGGRGFGRGKPPPRGWDGAYGTLADNTTVPAGDTTTLDDEILTFEEANGQKPKWIKLTPAEE
jgi:hypothetical protein